MFSLLLQLSVLAASISVHAQSPVWGQCGGQSWTGPTTCAAGSVCTYSNQWYSQCIPGTAPVTTVPAPSSTVAVPSSTVDSTVAQSSTVTDTAAPSSTRAAATCAIPANPAMPTNSKLPDPFLPISGARITTKEQWACRRQELNSLIQNNELGVKPPKPSSVTASFSGNSLSITASEAGKSISFSVSISYPSSGTAPYPAIIAYGGLSIPTPAGVAIITFNNDDIAAQVNTGSRGQGKFYTLYGTGHSAGALTAWAWGVSRIVDALEITSTARINPLKVGVTGCSRNGKGAIVAGALDDRIALTIPQESGSGGAACWRLSDSQKSSGANVQTASQIITENVWFSTLFNPYVNQVARLAFDHHSLAALVAPRGLFVIENTSQEWLGNMSTYGCMKVAQLVYQALGVPDAMGVSQVGNHNHCAFPSSQQAELTAFVGKFLLGQSTNTNIMRTDGSFNFNQAQWVDWTVPTLT